MNYSEKKFDLEDKNNIRVHKIIGINKNNTKVYFYLLEYIGKSYKVSFWDGSNYKEKPIKKGAYFVTFSVDNNPPTIAPVDVTYSHKTGTKKFMTMIEVANHPNIEFSAITQNQNG